MTLFSSDDAMCPYCKEGGAYLSVSVQQALPEDDFDEEVVLCLIYCQNKECGRVVGMGNRLVK